MRSRLLLLFTGLSCVGLGLLSLAPNWAAKIPVPASQPISPPVEKTEPDPNFYSYTLRPGTALQILLQTPINTAFNQPGDTVEGIMTRDLYLNANRLLSKNTRFIGVISRLEPPIQGMNALLAIRFTALILENGEQLPIDAHVRTEHPGHLWGGQVTPGTKPMLSTQRVAGIGEYNRIVFGGPRAMGQHIEFLPGEHWTIIMDQPLTLVLPKETEN
jgi:hypothetical protein